MPILKNVLGLDLGSHSLKTVELQQGLRSLEAVRVNAAPREDEALPLAAQVERLVQVQQHQTDNVVTALRSDRISLRRLTFPFAERRRVAQAVPFELEDQVPFELEDMVLDWEIAHRDRNRAEVVAALAPRDEVSRLVAVLHEARCDARVLEAEGFVLANLSAAFDLPGQRLLVDLGHEKTTLCGLRDGSAVAARGIGVAGRHFTEAIAQERALGLPEAERYKIENGLAEPGIGSPFPRAEALLDRLASEILRFANALEPVLPGGIQELTLLGGSAQLEHIDHWLAERTGIPAARLGLPREDTGLGFTAGGPPLVFAPALALALRGTPRASTALNLRQDDFARRIDLSRYRREFGPTGVLAAIVAGLALVSFTTGAVLESRRASQVESRIEALYSEAFPGRPVPSNPVASMREAVRQAEERAEFLGVYRGNLSALDVLTEISRRVPADLDVVFEELSIDKQTVRIRVFAKSFEAADRLGAELSKFGPFDQARIGAIETDKRTGSKKFNVTISLAAEETAS